MATVSAQVLLDKLTEMEKPFIYCFKLPIGNYFYDVNTNSIVKIDDDIYDYLVSLLKDKNTALNINNNGKIIEKIQSLKSKGFLSPWNKGNQKSGFG